MDLSLQEHDLMLADRRLKIREIAEKVKTTKKPAIDAEFSHSEKQAEPWDHFMAVLDAI